MTFPFIWAFGLHTDAQTPWFCFIKELENIHVSQLE